MVEHVGGEGFNESLLVLKRGGRLVTCGSTAGPSITFNLMQLFQQQYKIFGSFGASMKNIRESLDKMAAGLLPGFYVDTIAVAPKGAWPLPLPDHYAWDATHLAEYARLAATDKGFAQYLDKYVYEKQAA